jgi:hypothetical protein
MPMVEKFSEGIAKNANGKPLKGQKDKDGNALPSKIAYKFSWLEYPDHATLVEMKDQLTPDEEVKVRNDQRKIKARQAANQAALDAAGVVDRTAENDSQIRLKQAFSGYYAKLISKGMAADEARTLARAKAAEFLDEQWEEEAEED